MKTPHAACTDAELASLFNEGDKKAFGEIYERYWYQMLLHARKMLKDEVLAEDVVHDSFMLLLERMGEFELKDTIGSFLYRTIRNQILNMIRHQKVQRSYLDHLAAYANRYTGSADELTLEKELEERIEREIAQLPPKMRQVFELSRKAHLSHREIAQQHNVSELTVKKQVQLAVKLLRGKLGAVFFLHIMNVILLLSRKFLE